jgi:hypothetical protein
MNRIRGAYLELAPELEPYFVTSAYDDARGVMSTGGWDTFPTFGGFVTTAGVVAVIDAVVAGVVVSLLAAQSGLVGLAAATLGVAVAIA